MRQAHREDCRRRVVLLVVAMQQQVRLGPRAQAERELGARYLRRSLSAATSRSAVLEEQQPVERIEQGQRAPSELAEGGRHSRRWRIVETLFW